MVVDSVFEATKSRLYSCIKELRIDTNIKEIAVTDSKTIVIVLKELPYIRLRYVASNIKKCLGGIVHANDINLLIEVKGVRYRIEQLVKPCSLCILYSFCNMLRRLRKYC